MSKDSVKCVPRKFQIRFQKFSRMFQWSFCNFIVAWISLQLPEQKEGLLHSHSDLQKCHIRAYCAPKSACPNWYYCMILFPILQSTIAVIQIISTYKVKCMKLSLTILPVCSSINPCCFNNSNKQ